MKCFSSAANPIAATTNLAATIHSPAFYYDASHEKYAVSVYNFSPEFRFDILSSIVSDDITHDINTFSG